jgi:hypothetical protein
MLALPLLSVLANWFPCMSFLDPNDVEMILPQRKKPKLARTTSAK